MNKNKNKSIKTGDILITRHIIILKRKLIFDVSISIISYQLCLLSMREDKFIKFQLNKILL